MLRKQFYMFLHVTTNHYVKFETGVSEHPIY